MQARQIAVVAFALLAATLTAYAHSLADLERMLGSKEKFFQAIDKEAPNFTLADPDGRSVRLTDFRGKVVVLHFIYAACPDVCPLHSDRIGRVQDMVNNTPMKTQVQFISISTDPKNDTPDVLRAYGELHAFDVSNWNFLTTTSDQPSDATRKLAERFGHKFVEQKDGYQIHGIVTHIIDKAGRWRANFHGLRFDPVNLVLFVNALVNDVQRPHSHQPQGLWDRVKRFLGF